jgi:outer membrane protein assembly factor BamB
MGLVITLWAARGAWAADRPQWGERYSRNMVSDEAGLPDGFDTQSGRNVRWAAPLGTQCWSTPVVAQGKVFIGTNNDEPRDDRHQGDRGVLMCLDEADGRLLWQLVVPKLEGDIYLDWPRAGICSPATVEGDRVYAVTNRDEVVCLDIDGLADGNDGPYVEEGRHATPQGEPPIEAGPLDADILWLLDLRTAAGVRPHDSAHCSILLDGPFLYVNTSNGLTSKHDGVDKPEAPSLVVVDKATGRLVAEEREGISRKIFHSTWSSPALGEPAGRRLVFFAGGDGVVYAFDALRGPTMLDAARPEPLELVWRFDCDPTAPKENIHSYIRNRQVSPSNIKSMPVFHDGRVYVTVGGDIWWGKHEAWLKCIDAGGSGDVTHAALLWSYAVERHCCSTPAIRDGLVYVADCGGKVHCVDAETGKPCWVHDAGGEIWASTLVADGKLYVGTRRGQFWVLAAGREPKVLSEIRLDAPTVSTPVAANGTLYVGTMNRLYAVEDGRNEGR